MADFACGARRRFLQATGLDGVAASGGEAGDLGVVENGSGIILRAARGNGERVRETLLR